MTTIVTKDNGQIVPRSERKNDLSSLLQRMGPEIARAVPKHVNPDRMLRIALTALRVNPALMNCSPGSFLGCVLSAAQLGLEIGGPLAQAYLIPYKSECTLIVSYRGMLNLARRSGMVTAIYAHEVREGDRFVYRLGLNPTLEHDPADVPDRDAKPITHVYAVAKLKDAEPVFIVLTRAQVEAYRKRSRASTSGPWTTDFQAMALKTAVRRLFTWIPQSSEMMLAAAIDETTETGGRQLEAWDPSVTEALAQQGIDTEGETVVEGQTPVAS
jgi:recombination protein RecT